MSREKSGKKKGRRQRALTFMVWCAVVLAINTVLNIAPLFPFQGRRMQERRQGIDETRVIWEETEDGGKWDGEYYYLAVNEEVALFSCQQFSIGYGWESGGAKLLDLHPETPVSAGWLYERSEGATSMYVIGYVKEDAVASVEYRILRADDMVDTIAIRPDDYIYDGEQRYYVCNAAEQLMERSPEDPGYKIFSIHVYARDAEGNLIYQEKLFD